MTNCPEEALLLHSLRRFVDARGELDSPLLSCVTDWPGLFRLASRHGVTPLLYNFLDEASGTALPEPCSCELREGSRARARHSLSLTAQLLDVLFLFDLKGIPAVAFKGPALAAELYGNLALRDFDDIDILVPREDIHRAKEALLADGFSTDLPTHAAEQAAYIRARYELHFTARNGSLVEIHQAFLPPFSSLPFDYEALWQRLEQRHFCGRKILALAPEDLLIALCAHGTKHGWCRLVWICDIARLLVVHRSRLDWDQLLTRAAGMGALRMVLLGVLLADRLLGAPAPAELLEQAREDSSALGLARNVEGSLFASASPAAESHLFFLKARERLSDKLTYCTRLFFMPTEEDQAAFPLPPFLSPLHYPLHAVRVVSKYGLKSLKNPA